jgi:hypothetical protein
MSPAEEHSIAASKSNQKRLIELIGIINNTEPCKAYSVRLNAKMSAEELACQ